MWQRRPSAGGPIEGVEEEGRTEARTEDVAEGERIGAVSWRMGCQDRSSLDADAADVQAIDCQRQPRSDDEGRYCRWRLAMSVSLRRSPIDGRSGPDERLG